MNKLIILGLIPVLMLTAVPNVYATNEECPKGYHEKNELCIIDYNPCEDYGVN